MDVYALPWYFTTLPAEPGVPADLSGDEWHHARHVLRLQEGDPVILFDGSGNCWSARLTSAHRQHGQFVLMDEVTRRFRHDRSYKVILGLAPTKQIDRTEFAVEKLTELGVDEIVLLDCDHGERTKIRLDRLEKILVGAAKQSRKVKLPSLAGPVKPADAISGIRARHPSAQCFAAHLENTAGAFFHACPPAADVMVLIGPEGGFSEAEVQQFRAGGIPLVSLGPYRLRVETAAVAACITLHLRNQPTDTR